MTSSAYACFKLIDDIIKRGGQQVSDRYIVKACLGRTVLSNKKLIVNQLMKQTGIQSQFCTINQDFQDQLPRPIKKDKIIVKSANIIQKKNLSRPIAIDRGKSYSNSKTRMRKQTQTFDFQNTKLMTTKTTLMSEQKKQRRNNFMVELEGEGQKPKQNHQSIQMRRDKIQKEKQEEKIIKKFEDEQQKRRIKMNFQKNSFNRQLKSGNNQHTYHTDGKYLVYPTTNQKTLDSQFPISMSSIVCEKINQKKLANQVKQSTIDIFRKESKNRINEQEILYNNNNKRQISSVNFINAKPGVSFTEPFQGATIRGDKDQSEQNLVIKQKKPTFNKFFTKETTRRAKTQYNESNQKLVQNKLSLGIKSNRTEEIMTEKLNLQGLRCGRRKGGKGKIKDVNETLFTKYFNMK